MVALNETIRLMAEIDRVIEAHGGWPGAFAATIVLRRIGLQFERGENLRQKNPIAKPPADEVSVFADKTETGALS